jgi:hypothetical protein
VWASCRRRSGHFGRDRAAHAPGRPRSAAHGHSLEGSGRIGPVSWQPHQQGLEVTLFVQADFEASEEFEGVRSVAEHLLAALNKPSARALIAAANLPGNSSALVQATFLEQARLLGFVDESRGLFADYPTSASPRLLPAPR